MRVTVYREFLLNIDMRPNAKGQASTRMTEQQLDKYVTETDKNFVVVVAVPVEQTWRKE
jgi:hypothetical protein